MLDNFEHLLEGAGLLSAAPGLRLLVTSRAALELSGGHLFDLEEFSFPPLETTEPLNSLETIRLFNVQAARLSASFMAQGPTLEAVAALTHKVEGCHLRWNWRLAGHAA